MKALIVILRVVFGVFWFWAGLSKWIYGFDATAFLQGALVNHAVLSTPYSGLLTPAIEWAGKAGISIVNVIVPATEFALGVWFLADKNIRGAALGQTAVSLLFLTCGAISWNPLLLAGSVVMLALPVHKGVLAEEVGKGTSRVRRVA